MKSFVSFLALSGSLLAWTSIPVIAVAMYMAFVFLLYVFVFTTGLLRQLSLLIFGISILAISIPYPTLTAVPPLVQLGAVSGFWLLVIHFGILFFERKGEAGKKEQHNNSL